MLFGITRVMLRKPCRKPQSLQTVWMSAGGTMGPSQGLKQKMCCGCWRRAATWFATVSPRDRITLCLSSKWRNCRRVQFFSSRSLTWIVIALYNHTFHCAAFSFLWHNSPARAWAVSFLSFPDHTHSRHTHTHTLGMTPLNE
jgi:hypothetical protein